MMHQISRVNQTSLSGRICLSLRSLLSKAEIESRVRRRSVVTVRRESIREHRVMHLYCKCLCTIHDLF
jgi:hypothetical protein